MSETKGELKQFLSDVILEPRKNLRLCPLGHSWIVPIVLAVGIYLLSLLLQLPLDLTLFWIVMVIGICIGIALSPFWTMFVGFLLAIFITAHNFDFSGFETFAEFGGTLFTFIDGIISNSLGLIFGGGLGRITNDIIKFARCRGIFQRGL